MHFTYTFVVAYIGLAATQVACAPATKMQTVRAVEIDNFDKDSIHALIPAKIREDFERSKSLSGRLEGKLGHKSPSFRSVKVESDLEDHHQFGSDHPVTQFAAKKFGSFKTDTSPVLPLKSSLGSPKDVNSSTKKRVSFKSPLDSETVDFPNSATSI